MAINKIVAGVKGSVSNSTGAQIAQSVNEVIDTVKRSSTSNNIILFGDSFSYYQKDSSYNDAVIAASCWSWVLAKLGDSIDVVNFAGVGGDNSTQMLARLSNDVINVDSDFVFGQCGVNDFYGYDMTVDAVFNNVTNMITQINESGKFVVWLNCPPQDAARSGFSPAKSLKAIEFNRKLFDWCKTREGVRLVDVYSDLVDRNDNVNSSARTGVMSTDNIHLSVYGAFVYSESFFRDAGDLFVNKNLNSSFGALESSPLTNGSFSGSGGTIGAQATGVAPDGWIVSGNGGVSVNTSQNYQGYVCDVSCVGAVNDRLRLQSYDLSTSFLGGEDLTLELTAKIDAAECKLTEFRVYLYSVGDEGFATGDWGRVVNGYTESGDIQTGRFKIKTNNYKILTNPTDVRVYIDARFSGDGAASVVIESARII